jgi:hypothetical protein
MMNAALSYSPDQWKGWNLYAKMLDLLQTNQSGGYTGATNQGMAVFQRDWMYDYEGRIIEVGISYTFNQSKEEIKQRIIGNDYF